MVTAGTGAIWQRALAHLQANSWSVNRVPSARNWIEFFSACSLNSSIEKTTDRKYIWTTSLPMSVHSLIGDSIVDAVKLARLQQLFSSLSSTGVFKETSEKKETVKHLTNSDNLALDVSCGIPEDVTGVFLSTKRDNNNNNNGAYSSELVELLCHYSAAYQSPHNVEQLEFWLRDVVKFLQFFTLNTLPHYYTTSSKRLYITHTEALYVLHHGLCALCLQPSSIFKTENITQGSFTNEAALLSLWLLHKLKSENVFSHKLVAENNDNSNNNNNNSLCFNELLRKTQMLLATRKETCAWLFHMPVIFRAGNNSVTVGYAGKEEVPFLVGLMERSFICRVARDVFSTMFLSSDVSLATVCVPFVDEFSKKDETAVRLMNEQLSRIALGNSGV